LININDVAKAAGVSTATVSRALDNKSSVKPKNRDAVLAAVHQLNYKPNALARQMRTQKTHSVIVTVPDIRNTFFSEVIFGIEQCANEHDYQVLIADIRGQSDAEKYYFQAIQQRSIDGIISLSANVAKSLIEQVAKKYPIVVACQFLDNYNVPNVTIDNIRAAESITNHLIQLGHRKIAHITGRSSTALVYRDRLNGYISALAKHNLSIDLQLVRYGDASVQSGYDNMKMLLELDDTITAVFAAGDAMALGAIRALTDSGLRVPEDCAVVGFDDIDISTFCRPSLTTVRQPKHLIGETAFKTLLKLMNHEPLETIQVVLDYEIIIRESCGYQQHKKEMEQL